MTTRVFIGKQPQNTDGREVELSEQEAHYALRVRRLKHGDSLLAMDGVARQWTATITSDKNRKCSISLDNELVAPEGPGEVTLLVGRPDVAASLELLSGACELDVHAVAFVDTERSQRRGPSAERLDKTIRAAMRQCGRFSPPRLLHFPTLTVALGYESHLPCVFGDLEPRDTTEPKRPFTRIPPPCRLAVGPEGGWSRDERALLIKHGANPIQLSPWVLRTPTAALSIVAKTLDL